jgi:hypothetical protein
LLENISSVSFFFEILLFCYNDIYLAPERENLCLYGLPNETWEVTLPAEEVPPELPEPALGINFARDGMVEKDWLSLVAVHSDAWLLSVAFYFGARFGFDKDARYAFNILFKEYFSVFFLHCPTTVDLCFSFMLYRCSMKMFKLCNTLITCLLS